MTLVQLINSHGNATTPREGTTFRLFHLRSLGGEGMGIVAKLVLKRGQPYLGGQSINYVHPPSSEGGFGHLTRRGALTMQRGQELPIGKPYCNRILVPVSDEELRILGYIN